MSIRLWRGAAIATVIFLGGCNDRVRLNADEAYDLADAAQANARSALGRNEEQDSQITALERKVQDLESTVQDLESKLSALGSTLSENARIANENGRLMDERWEAYKRHVH